jgi:glycosyltransferase involved in cell wall biosynthesis
MNISVAIITLNEEDSIEYTLKSAQWANEIVVVDSGSTDKTIDIAKQYGSKVFVREFDDFSSQKNFAISKCSNKWVISLDADEVVSPQLEERLKGFMSEDKTGYRIKRQTYIFGRLMKQGGHDKDAPLRFFNKEKASFNQPIHEYVEIEGNIGLIEEPIVHYSSRTISEYMKKLNLYTALEAEYMFKKKTKFSHVSIFLKPLAKFIQRYILQKGFCDGVEGLIFYTLSGFYDFIKWFKYWELIKKEKA